MIPDPATSAPPWYDWNDGPKPARSWPSPKADVDVHRDRLKRVGLEMQTDTGGLSESEVKGGLPPQTGLPPGSDTFGAGFYGDSSASGPLDGRIWKSIHAVEDAVERFADAVQNGAYNLSCDYVALGYLVFASGVNYDRAEGIFDKNLPDLTEENLGRGTTHETYSITSKYPWQEEDTSPFDAPLVKECLNAVHVAKLNDKAGYCTRLAEHFTDLQETVEGRARQLAGAWPGQTSEFALDALRKLQATYRTLAYATGTTSGTLSWLAGVLHQYQLGFEDTVKLGDHEFDDDLPNWMLPSGGGAHDRAREYLRELNTHLATAYNMLPKQIETLVPDVPTSPLVPSYDERTGLKDDSRYWDFVELDLANMR
ncbi:hypothetical protein [Nonomuraea sp. NPDC002799]